MPGARRKWITSLGVVRRLNPSIVDDDPLGNGSPGRMIRRSGYLKYCHSHVLFNPNRERVFYILRKLLISGQRCLDASHLTAANLVEI